MNIIPVNNNNQNFSGKLYTKGKWPKNLHKSFTESPHVRELTEGRDVFARISEVCTCNILPNAYRIDISAYKENCPLNRVKHFLHLGNEASLTINPHLEQGMIDRLDEVHFDYVKRELNIK